VFQRSRIGTSKSSSLEKKARNDVDGGGGHPEPKKGFLGEARVLPQKNGGSWWLHLFQGEGTRTRIG